MAIRWHSPLYTGRKAAKKRRAIIQSIREGRLMIRAYVITPPSDGHNILDIYPAYLLLAPGMADRDWLILGIAYGYHDALEAAGRIVQDVYRRTGGFRPDGGWGRKPPEDG